MHCNDDDDENDDDYDDDSNDENGKMTVQDFLWFFVQTHF